MGNVKKPNRTKTCSRCGFKFTPARIKDKVCDGCKAIIKKFSGKK